MGVVQTGTLVKRKLIWRLVGAPLLALVCATASTGAALAHQPFLENPDTTASTPIPVKDPAISTALFATLERPGDVDFYMFTVAAGQSIEIGMTIPQIAGQEEFTPSVGVIAAGLDSSAVSELPEEVRTLVSTQTGATVLEPVEASFPLNRSAARPIGDGSVRQSRFRWRAQSLSLFGMRRPRSAAIRWLLDNGRHRAANPTLAAS
jgi:hypothetical protein